MNWKSIIGEIRAAGLTQAQIAQRCGCGQTTISDLASGKCTEPRYSLGRLLVDLHNESVQHASEPTGA